MKRIASTMTNMVLVLTIVSVLAAGVLATVNRMTLPKIEKINKDMTGQGVRKVMGNENIQVASPDTCEGNILYRVTDSNGQSLGTAVVTETQGFGGPLKVMVGFSTEGVILGYTVLGTSETPGLGTKASSWFQKGGKGDIVGKNPSRNKLAVKQDKGEIDAITASTITSRAFLAAINNAYRSLNPDASVTITSASVLQQDTLNNLTTGKDR